MNARVQHPTHQDSHTASYYAASSHPQPDHPALQGEVKVDVCVVGGGFSGLNPAIELPSAV